MKAQFDWGASYPTQFFKIDVNITACEVTSIIDPSVIKNHVYNIYGGIRIYEIKLNGL